MYEDALARVDLFSGLRKKELQEVASCCRENTYRPGSVLISQGEKGLGLFILTKGTVRITRANSPDGAEQVLGTVEAGNIFGEMALLDDQPRSATVTAVDEVTALVVPFWDFRIILRRLLRSDPDVGLELMAVLSRRLRKAEQRVNE
ncbi:MAG TPA: cyclic nucleotide-binding domain-containing protein [Ktedonobacteraceae bacterium]|nr:cyclic nucleotide-binding domain-containing protein [Ktedonobacteraceae bacterium]